MPAPEIRTLSFSSGLLLRTGRVASSLVMASSSRILGRTDRNKIPDVPLGRLLAMGRRHCYRLIAGKATASVVERPFRVINVRFALFAIRSAHTLRADLKRTLRHFAFGP